MEFAEIYCRHEWEGDYEVYSHSILPVGVNRMSNGFFAKDEFGSFQ